MFGSAVPSPLMSRTLRNRVGFTLVEAMVALSITSLAGSVLLLAVETSLETTSDAVDRMVAEGLADQMINEISSKRFVEVGSAGNSATFGPAANESSGSGRERYNDSDDYYAYSSSPIQGVWGEALGTGNDAGGQRHANFRLPSGFFDGWRQRVSVYFVDPVDHSKRLNSGTSYYRAAEVIIEYVGSGGAVKTLAKRRRVYAYIDPPST